MWQLVGVRTIVADSPHEVATAAAWFIQRRARSAIRLRGRFRLAVSGGSTPALMFDALVGLSIAWDRVDLFQVDERIAPDGDADRNATQLQARLLRHVPIPVRQIHLMDVTAATPTLAATRYAAALGDTPLDVAHLGLGDDAHTASWPPGDPVVQTSAAVAITSEYRGRRRMTLTPLPINSARARLMVVCGAEKAAALHAWVKDRDDVPVRHLHRTGTTLIVDRAAASQLTRG